MQYIGHRAIQATISSQALHASNFKVQLGLIMPPLVITLSTSSISANVLAKK